MQVLQNMWQVFYKVLIFKGNIKNAACKHVEDPLACKDNLLSLSS